MTTTPATPSEGRPLTRAQSIILGTAGVAMVGIGVVGAVGTYTNLTTRFPGPTALGFVAAGEGATVILALAYVGLTMLGQSSPAAVRLGLWLLPSLASGTGATVAHSVRDAVVYAVTPVAMCVAAEGAGLLARRIVVRTTGTDAEAQRRNAVTMRRLAYERARAANHPRGRTRRRAELASWRLARHVGTGDTALGTHLVTVQRERLAEGADLALAAMFTPAVTAVTAGRDAIEPAVTGGVTAVTPGRDGVTAAVTPALPEAPEPPPAGAETGDAVTPVTPPVTDAVTQVSPAEPAPGVTAVTAPSHPTVTAVTLGTLAAVTGVTAPVTGELLSDAQLDVVLRWLRYQVDPPLSYRQAVAAFRDAGYVGSEERVRRAWGALMSREETDGTAPTPVS